MSDTWIIFGLTVLFGAWLVKFGWAMFRAYLQWREHERLIEGAHRDRARQLLEFRRAHPDLFNARGDYIGR